MVPDLIDDLQLQISDDYLEQAFSLGSHASQLMFVRGH